MLERSNDWIKKKKLFLLSNKKLDLTGIWHELSSSEKKVYDAQQTCSLSGPILDNRRDTDVLQSSLKESCLKELFTNFEYITFLSCLYQRNIFYKRSISIKQLWLEIIEKIGCSKSVGPSTVIYIVYITRTNFEHHFSQLFPVRAVWSRLTF